jgi:hypothetical protein
MLDISSGESSPINGKLTPKARGPRARVLYTPINALAGIERTSKPAAASFCALNPAALNALRIA